MTEQEIANRLFGTGTSGSATSQSLLSGVAVEASSGGQVKVQIDGAQIGIGDQDSVLLDTTCSVAAGQRVTITLFGRDGQGKKAFVSGVVGGSGGGGGGDIDELEQRMDAAESAISDLQSSTSTLATRMSTAESDIDTLQSSDTSQNQRLNAAESNISSLQSTTTALGTRVTNAESAITGLQSTTSGLSTRMSTAESDIDALESTTSGLSTRLSDAEDDIDDLQSDMTAAQGSLTSLGTRMSTAEGNITSLQSTTSSLGTRLSTAEGDIDDLDDRVTALEQGGGGDPGLANRVTQCESDIEELQSDMSDVKSDIQAIETDMTAAQSNIVILQSDMLGAKSDITALQTRLSTDESKINEVIGVLNDFKWQRLYLWTLAGYSRASLWYRKATGEVLVAVNINGSMNSGWNWYNTGAALPADLRPTAFPTAALVSARNTIWANPLILICSGDDGRVSAYLQNSGTSSEGGTISYLVQPGLNYSSTTWTGPDISQLSLTRALAARIALGDGLAEQQDLEKDEAAYNKAFDIIFGDEK